MNLLIGFSILLASGIASVLAYLVRKVAFGGELPVTSEWIEDLSLDRYRPMLRMLDGDDIEFLRSQPGFTPGMATKLRAQRTQIFRGYLKSLETRFCPRLLGDQIDTGALQERSAGTGGNTHPPADHLCVLDVGRASPAPAL